LDQQLAKLAKQTAEQLDQVRHGRARSAQARLSVCSSCTRHGVHHYGAAGTPVWAGDAAWGHLWGWATKRVQGFRVGRPANPGRSHGLLAQPACCCHCLAVLPVLPL
jgi:hypothetical protein